MSKKERRDVGRLDTILELLKQDKSTEEIQEILDEMMVHGRARQRKGEESEEWAASLLGDLKIVRRVVRFERGSGNDREQRDLRIFFDRKHLRDLLSRKPSIKNVWVQVKSSREGVLSFRAMYGESDEEINQNLAEERLVVINPRAETQEIIESFIQQVDYIDRYWAETS